MCVQANWPHRKKQEIDYVLSISTVLAALATSVFHLFFLYSLFPFSYD